MTDARASSYDLIVVGGGHAGCEAAYAAARLGLSTALITFELNKLAFMSCNPSIGGPAKGHLTREIDALGGLQGEITDATYLNLRMLNTGKGASVRALRAQSDRQGYTRQMLRRLQQVPGLTLIEGEATDILVRQQPAGDSRAVTGVQLADGSLLNTSRIVIAPGTFTRAFCILGDRKHAAGRWGEQSANALGECLERLGVVTHRLKTGTSPRIAAGSVDYTKVSPQLSEWRTAAFQNYRAAELPSWFLPCWLSRTNQATHELIEKHIHESAMYSGAIQGAGPRYCPSIEDKLTKFPEARAHPVFIEPDGLEAGLMYLQGISTSLPLDVQRAFLATIPGLESARIRQPGYAVEYDAINPIDLSPELMVRGIEGLYCAGQFNGTSGYEEAAAQGLAAGANAALSLKGREPLPLTRENSYVGVLIDDLTTRGTDEPYRMLTARAEHRLLLRHDNAALRLGPIARDWGLLSAEQVSALEALRTKVHAVKAELAETKVSIARQQELGIADKKPQGIRGTAAVQRGAKVVDVLVGQQAGFSEQAALAHVEVEVRYAGYLKRALEEISRMRRQEEHPIPPEFDFAAVHGILKATREKLSRVCPTTLGQAGRVAGVTPADLANLLVALKAHHGSPDK